MSDPTLARLHVDGLEHELLVTRYTCEEGVSRLFEASVELASDAAALSFDALALRPAHLEIRGLTGRRHVHGVVARWEYLRTGLARTYYRLTLVPRAHRLTLRQDLRVFQRQRVQEIAREVLLAAGLHADEFRLDLAGEHPQRDYVVQYRETDLEFLHRICAREGVYYFFEHSEAACVLVLADHPDAHPPAPGAPDELVHDPGFTSTRERLLELRAAAKLCPGKLTLRDFDPLHPSLPVQLDQLAAADRDFEIVDFPGGFVEEGLPHTGLGLGAVLSRFGAAQAGRDGAEGESDCPVLTAGHGIKVGDNPRAALDGAYVVTHLVHEGAQPGVEQVDAREPSTYKNRFSAVRAGAPVPLPAAPERREIPGLQTAIVTGPAGARVHTDELGRIKVQFHWDRQGRRDERSSCWVRVTQPWGGHEYGLLTIPRIGAEVVVAFLEGDPERPVVLGCLYSGDNAAPHALPAAASRSTWRSQSLPGAGFNEICLEDSAGSEQIFVRGEQDLSLLVRRDVKSTVQRDEHRGVTGTRATRVNAEHLTVDHDRVERVGGSSVTAVQHLLHLHADELALDANRGVALTGGADLKIASSGGVIVVDAARGLTLKGPCGASITIDAQGQIHLQGTRLFLNTGGAPLTADAPRPPAPPTPKTPTAADEP